LPAAATTATFQVTLRERDGSIVFRYADVGRYGLPHENGGSATVGIEDAHGLEGMLLSYNQRAIVGPMAIEFRPEDPQPPVEVVPAAGRSIDLRDTQDRPDKRQLSFDAQDASILAPEPDGAGDPMLHGALLRIENPLSGEAARSSSRPRAGRPARRAASPTRPGAARARASS
jgi:hypothetical protein